MIFRRLTAVLALSALWLAPTLSASAMAPTGGSNQRTSVEGCLGQTLFNGVWRLTVTESALKTNPDDPDYKNWGVTVELRNGKNAQNSPGDSGFQEYPQIAFADSSVLDMNTAAQVQFQNGIFYKSLPPGGVARMTMFYRLEGDNMTKVPTKLLMSIKKTEYGKTFGYTVADPSFRVKLDCTA
jgi:hypothetical protein